MKTLAHPNTSSSSTLQPLSRASQAPGHITPACTALPPQSRRRLRASPRPNQWPGRERQLGFPQTGPLNAQKGEYSPSSPGLCLQVVAPSIKTLLHPQQSGVRPSLRPTKHYLEDVQYVGASVDASKSLSTQKSPNTCFSLPANPPQNSLLGSVPPGPRPRLQMGIATRFLFFKVQTRQKPKQKSPAGTILLVRTGMRRAV